MNDKIKTLSEEQKIKMIEMLIDSKEPYVCMNCVYDKCHPRDCPNGCTHGNDLWEFDFALLED